MKRRSPSPRSIAPEDGEMSEEDRIRRLERIVYQLASTLYGQEVAEQVMGLAAPQQQRQLLGADEATPRQGVNPRLIQYIPIGDIPSDIEGDLLRLTQTKGDGNGLGPPKIRYARREVNTAGAATVTLVLINGGIAGMEQMPAAQSREMFMPRNLAETLAQLVAIVGGRVVVWVVHPSQRSQLWNIRDLQAMFAGTPSVAFGQVKLLDRYRSPQRIMHSNDSNQPNIATISETLWAALKETRISRR